MARLPKCLVTLLVTVLSIQARITILENTRERFSFLWELTDIDTASFERNGQRSTFLSFSGSNDVLARDDEPIIPAYSFTIGVPQQGDIIVRFDPSAVATVRLIHPVATPDYPDGASKPPQSILQNTWISQSSYSRYRSLRTASVTLCPLRCDASTRTVTYVTRGIGTIEFPRAEYRLSPEEKGDFESMLRRMVLNHDIARGWKARTPPGKKAAVSYPLPPDLKTYTFRIGDGHEGFNEATNEENGILKIPGNRVRELFGKSGISQVRLYAAFKGMLPEYFPADSSIPDGVEEVPLLRVDHDEDGILDDDEYLLAYVTGASDWEADKKAGDYRFIIDRYDDYRTYWLTVAGGIGRTVVRRSEAATTADSTVTRYTGRILYKRSIERRKGDKGSREWIWKVLSNGIPTHLERLDLSEGLKEGGWIDVRGFVRNGGTFDLALDGERICSDCDLSSPQSTGSHPYPFGLLKGGELQFAFRHSATDTSQVELESFTVGYRRALAIGDTAEILTVYPEMADSGKVLAYELDVETDRKVYVFKVLSGEEKTELVDTISGAKGHTLRWIDTAWYDRRYIICNEPSLRSLPELSEPYRSQWNGGPFVRDLRAAENRTGFLVITHPDFAAAADSLVRHKRRMGHENPVVVDVNDVYRFFSGGDKDVTAIRNFLSYVTRHWNGGGALDYVVLMGAGHYDAKNLAHTEVDFIPVYIDGNSCYEDYYSRTLAFQSGNAPQFALGRLPCRTLDQAWAMVRKIVESEDPGLADFSEWRNRMLFVADDDMQGERNDGIPHHRSADLTSALVDSLQPSIDTRKVYLYEYEWDRSRQKPSASRALINEINGGVGYITFFGHGSDVTWTDEYILTREMTAGMYNDGRYPVVAAFSCSVGKFDEPGTASLSEALVTAPGVGAIAVISATRETYAPANEELSIDFYHFLLDSASTRTIGMSLAAVFVGKPNLDRSYAILGDPSIRAVRATRKVTLTIDDPDDTLAALQEVVVSGTITVNGKIDREFDGDAYVAIGLFNPPDTVSRKDGGDRQQVRYALPGNPVFLGKTKLVMGKFSQKLLVPQKLSFHRPGSKLTAYAWKEGSADAGAGCRRDLVFGGSVASSKSKDTEGPRISIRPVYEDSYLSGREASFTDRITTQPPVKCEIELHDPSGIDVAGNGPDEGVTVAIEGVVARQNVNNKFRFREGDFRRGVVSLEYGELKPGKHVMTVTARDLFGNLSKARFTVVVTDKEQLRLDHVLNFPNPMRMGTVTRFYCHTNYTARQTYGNDVRLTVRIYSLGGKLLRVIDDGEHPGSRVHNGIEWDGRDERGHPLGPDVYLYRITAVDRGPNGRKVSRSRIMKLVILPPR